MNIDTNRSIITTDITSLTHKSPSSLQFSANDIKSTINKLNSNKAYGHDIISILMIKLCDDSINKPLEIIFKSCLTQGVFPEEWHKPDEVSVYKIRD